jgi:hypothetical protein
MLGAISKQQGVTVLDGKRHDDTLLEARFSKRS